MLLILKRDENESPFTMKGGEGSPLVQWVNRENRTIRELYITQKMGILFEIEGIRKTKILMKKYLRSIHFLKTSYEVP